MGASKRKAKKAARKRGKQVKKAAKQTAKLLSRATDKAIKSLGGAKKIQQSARKFAEAAADALVGAVTKKKK